MPIKVKKSSKSGRGKTQSQKQTVIVNIDKRRRARNPKQDLLKEQALKLEQLREISRMRSPEFNHINMKLEEFKKEREASLKKEEEALKKKEEEDKKQALIKEEEKRLNQFKENKLNEEKDKVNMDIMDIKKRLEEISKYGKEYILNKEQNKEKEFIQEPTREEKPKSYIKIPKNKILRKKYKIVKPEETTREEEETKEDEVQPQPQPPQIKIRKPRQESVTVGKINSFLSSLSVLPEDIIPEVRNFRNTGKISNKLKQYYRNRN